VKHKTSAGLTTQKEFAMKKIIWALFMMFAAGALSSAQTAEKLTCYVSKSMGFRRGGRAD
jgi:hypothetical protein